MRIKSIDYSLRDFRRMYYANASDAHLTKRSARAKAAGIELYTLRRRENALDDGRMEFSIEELGKLHRAIGFDPALVLALFGIEERKESK